jgi:Ca2+-binding RTX toxin-like protein
VGTFAFQFIFIGRKNMIEQLERRCLFSATLSNGLLTVTGTGGDDTIEIFSRALTDGSAKTDVVARINDVEEGQFDIDQVTQIRVDALGGNDSVALNSLRPRIQDLSPSIEKPVSVPAHIEGGAGSDTLWGGAGSDTLVGGSHSDLIAGGGGGDLISGGRGNDLLSVGTSGSAVTDGSNTLGGGDDNDTLIGGSGADRFEGGRGIDTVDYSNRSQNLLISLGEIVRPSDWPVHMYSTTLPLVDHGYTAQPYPDFNAEGLYGTGKLENDFVRDDVENAIGGSGNDVLWGSDRVNVLDGKGGNDQIFGGLGTDAMYGGDGDDRLFAADARDAFPTIDSSVTLERIHGNAGRDYAMIDWADKIGTGVATVSKIETLPALTS